MTCVMNYNENSIEDILPMKESEQSLHIYCTYAKITSQIN